MGLQEAIAELKRIRTECAAKTPFGKREKIDGVDCIVHRPNNSQTDRVLFLFLHGGAWVGGDAAMLDSFCKTVCERVGCVAVNINYTKADEKPFPYAIEEVLRIMRHCSEHRAEYGIDPNKIVVSGCSAGGHLSACVAYAAMERSIPLAKQILIYPFVDWTGLCANPLDEWGLNGVALSEWEPLFFSELEKTSLCLSPAAASEEQLSKIAPADIILCGNDALREHSVFYYEKLKRAGVQVSAKEYPEAVHGFLELNRPDYPFTCAERNSEQDAMARDCEDYIVSILQSLSKK